VPCRRAPKGSFGVNPISTSRVKDNRGQTWRQPLQRHLNIATAMCGEMDMAFLLRRRKGSYRA
jgi:hypothetical protein